MEVKCSFEAIQILSPSMAIPYSLRGANVEALHNPMVKTNIMSEFLVKTLLGNIPLVSTNKTLKKSIRTHFRVLWDSQGCANHNKQNQGFHRFPHLCHP
jgi:hypothetical protein